MKPKPSRRRDSLEKAAMEEAAKHFDDPGAIAFLTGTILRFATRHGAKVRRETLKEQDKKTTALRVIYTWASVDRGRGLDPTHVMNLCQSALSLTPRGPEKGRKR